MGLTLAIFSIGCVTQKKYDDILTEKNRLESENTDCEEELNIVTNKLTRSLDELERLHENTLKLSDSLIGAAQKNQIIQKDYNELDNYYNNLLLNSGKLNRKLSLKAQELLALQESLELEKGKNETLKSSLEDRSQRIAELENILAEKEITVKSLKKKVTNALLNFDEDDLKVDIQNGKVYVSLAEQLLFRSGSVEIDKKGANAIEQLGRVLTESPDIQIMVEGHTDNVPVSKISRYMQDNWDLSVMRATAIIRILIRAGVAPDRLLASGRSEYSPISINKTDKDRSANRRTEIILTPKLNELFQILESN